MSKSMIRVKVKGFGLGHRVRSKVKVKIQARKINKIQIGYTHARTNTSKTTTVPAEKS